MPEASLLACPQILAGVVDGLEGREVDVVLLVDRLDLYRIDDVDQQARCPPCAALLLTCRSASACPHLTGRA